MDWREIALVAVLVVVVVLALRQQRAEQRRMPSSREASAAEGENETTAAPHPEQVARIRVYLERYRDVYNVDALRRKLLADGHNRRAVDAAVAEIFGQNALPLARRERFFARWERQDWLIFWGALLFNLLVLPAILAATSRGTFSSGQALVNALLTPLIVLGELVLAGVIRRRFPALHGVFWASLLYFATFPIALGTCIAIFNGVAG